MQFLIKPFSGLSVKELFEAYQLRSAVFVVEQNCAYQDPDEKDPEAMHLLMYEDQHLAGYARILPPGVSYTEPSIGRVVVAKHYRRNGSGRQLMHRSIRLANELFREQDLVISAQTYLLEFYTSLGFVAEGQVYPEDNIPHIKMRRRWQN